MKKCEHCNVLVNTNFNNCPLCFNEIVEINNSEPVEEIFVSPEKQNKIKSKKSIIAKVFLFLSVIAVVITTAINLMVKPWPLWSLISTISILYVWVLVWHTIISKRSVFEKLFLQVCVVLALLFACEWISGGKTWMVDYVVPSISMAIISVLFILSVSLKNHKGLLAFFIMNIILTLLSGILLLCKVPSFTLLNLITVIIGSVAILGILLFNGRALKIEFSKKFHI